MLPECCKNGLIISKTPLIQEGLKGVITGNFPDYRLAYCRTIEELTLLQLRRSDLIIADLAVNNASPRTICEYFYSLLSQYRDIHWVFLVPESCYIYAVDFLMAPISTLLSDEEPVENLISVIHGGNAQSERISKTLLSPQVSSEIPEPGDRPIVLTLSERKVLRLLGKGWGINQIAALLKKVIKQLALKKIALCDAYQYTVMQRCMHGSIVLREPKN